MGPLKGSPPSILLYILPREKNHSPHQLWKGPGSKSVLSGYHVKCGGQEEGKITQTYRQIPSGYAVVQNVPKSFYSLSISGVPGIKKEAVESTFLMGRGDGKGQARNSRGLSSGMRTSWGDVLGPQIYYQHPTAETVWGPREFTLPTPQRP